LGYPDDAWVIPKGIFIPAQHWILQSVPPNYRIEEYCQLLLLDTCSPMVGWAEARSSWVLTNFFGYFILPFNFLKFPHFKQIISRNYVQLVWIFQKFALVEVRKMKKTLYSEEEGNALYEVIFLNFSLYFFWILPKLSSLALEKEHILQ
jgi:hypothetical protein